MEAKVKEEVQFAFTSVETMYYIDSAKDAGISKNDYLCDKDLLTKYVSENGVIESVVDVGGKYIINYRTKEQNKLYTYRVDEKGNFELLESNPIDTFGETNLKYSNYYGKLVEGYTPQKGSNWRLFYADNNYAYLISNVFGGVSKLDNTELVKGFGTSKISLLAKNLNPHFTLWEEQESNYNIQEIAAVLDPTQWTEFTTDDAMWAVGAPTIEMLFASYNATHTDEMHEMDNNIISQQLQYTIMGNQNNMGYRVKRDSDDEFSEFASGLGKNSDLDRAIYCNTSFLYWIASPMGYTTTGVMYLNGVQGYTYYYQAGPCYISLRPLVSVPLSKVGLDGEGKKITITNSYF